MTMQCVHERLILVSERRSQCANCAAVIEAGDGLCPRCHRPLDDPPHKGAIACK